MASVTVTNQTLTMTIDIDGIETVIRKDNCKVQAFGTMVRITDYKGSIYEFLYSDCTAPSQPNANALRDAIEAFLNTGGGGGGGGGITSITSTNSSINIDNTNPSIPNLSARAISSTVSGNTATFIASAGSRLTADLNGYRPLFISGTEEANVIVGFFSRANASAGSLQADAIANATDSTDVITQLNLLLTAMRNYGLIAE
jgi:hypothetical protein